MESFITLYTELTKLSLLLVLATLQFNVIKNCLNYLRLHKRRNCEQPR